MKTTHIWGAGLCVLSSIIVSGCTSTLPLSMNLKYIPNAPALQSTVSLVIADGLQDLQIKETSGLDTWVFMAGAAIRTNVANALGTTFREVTLLSDTNSKTTSTDYFLSVTLVNYRIQRAATIWATHRISLDIDYRLTDKNGKDVFLTHSEGLGECSKSTAAANGQFIEGMLIGPLQAGAARSSHNTEFALAWDRALASSIAQLMQDVKQHIRATK